MRRSALFFVLSLACVSSASGPRHTPSAVVAPTPPPATIPAEAPLSFLDGSEVEDPGGSRVATAPDANVCAVADDNIERAAQTVLAAPPPTGPAPHYAPWDHRTPPRHLDRVMRRFRLRPTERELLTRNGFVVLAREERPGFADALHDVYRSELPLYVSVDAVFNAVFRSNDALIADLEAGRLAPTLDRALSAAHSALPSAAASYPPDVARDLDVYLTVARSLLADTTVHSRLGTDEEAARIIARARAANDLTEVELFGRARMVDFSQYTPRGHYASRPHLAPYFRAAMWLSRLEFNLVSRSSRSSAPGITPDPTETPRETVVAVALSDLLERAGVTGDIARLDRAWSLLAGPREDISLTQLAELRASAGVTDLRSPDVAAKIRAAIGDRFQRTARTHYMPQGSGVLPAIASMLGPRINPDTAMTRPLVHSAVGERYDLGAGDAAYALGHDRALGLLASDLQEHQTLRAQLDVAREIAHRPHAANDLYGAWYDAVLALGERPEGTLPSFMTTEAYADLRMSSALNAYGQLRHNYVLMAGQSYDEGGCAIPDAWVEPAPAVYDALIAYTERGAAAVHELADGSDDLHHAQAYFVTLAARLRVLRAIVRDELAGRALSPEALRFLSMVVEITPGSSDGPPTYTGWYFDLFRSRVNEGLADAHYIADWYTSSNSGNVAYLGAKGPRMGVFVVDVGGVPRAFVGPVASSYEHRAPLSHRLNDEEARELASVSARWEASYTAPAPAVPPLAVSAGFDEESPETSPLYITLRSTRALGRVTVELLDHHHVPFRELAANVGARPTRLTARLGRGQYAAALAVRAGEFRAVIPMHWYGTGRTFGGISAE